MENCYHHQFFTSNAAKDGAQRNLLGRINFGKPRKDFEEEILISYATLRFVSSLHVVSAERIPMKKNILLLFPSPNTKKHLKQQIPLEEKEKLVNVLAAVPVKMSSGGVGYTMNLQYLQVTDILGLFVESKDVPFH